MNKSGKTWGETREIFRRNNVEVHRIEAHKGGYCSKHQHLHKYNQFYVEKGILQVDVWKNDYDLCDTTQLHPGETMTVPPGELHRFTALSDVVAWEIYWVELEPGDIERVDKGGTAKQAVEVSER